jgi:hypothetical protein
MAPPRIRAWHQTAEGIRSTRSVWAGVGQQFSGQFYAGQRLIPAAPDLPHGHEERAQHQTLFTCLCVEFGRFKNFRAFLGILSGFAFCRICYPARSVLHEFVIACAAEDPEAGVGIAGSNHYLKGSRV